jgi:hypothetical protein
MLQRLVLYKGNDPAAQERIIAVARGLCLCHICTGTGLTPATTITSAN